MHKITIILNNSQSSIQLTFKDEVKARAMQTKIEGALAAALDGAESNILIEDEYGHRANLFASVISASLLTNIQYELNYTVDYKVMEHRAQKKLEQAIQMDPSSKLAIGGRA